MTLDLSLQTLWQAALLAALGALVPLALYRLHGVSLTALAVNLFASALALTAFGAVLFGALYLRQGVPLSPALAGHFLTLGLSGAIVWGPVLLLTGLGLAQRSETRAARAREVREAAGHGAGRGSDVS